MKPSGPGDQVKGFCYSPENTNGLIREFFPKGTDFSKVSEDEVQRVFSMINDRPRKVLGFRTAREAYSEEVLHLA